MTPTLGLLLAALAADPVAAEGPMNWNYDPDIPKLAYGVEGTGNVLAMLECRPHSGRILITSFAETAPRRLRVILGSGGTVSRFAAKAVVSQMDEEMIIETVAPVSDPVLAAFAGGGDLTIEGAGSRTHLPPAPEAGALLKACAR